MSETAPSDLRRRHILVVEDNEDARDILAMIFRHCGAFVTTAASAERGLAVFHVLTVHALVSDLHLGGGRDGVSMMRKIRELRRDLPAIAVTADATLEHKAIAAGFTHFMVKPADPWRLCGLVAAATGNRAA